MNYYNELYCPNDGLNKIESSWDILEKDININMSNRKEKNYKIYVIGYGKSYGSWIEGYQVDNMEEADVVVLTGGEDISPKLYGEPVGSHTYFGKSEGGISKRDAFEVEEYTKARALNKPIWGTCRGAQLLCAMAGGKLIQDMSHYGSHKLHFYDEEYTCVSNTLHHQMQYPYLMPKESYYILANTLGLSTRYLDGNNKPMEMPDRTDNNIVKEPEFVYYPKIRGLGIQGHPSL